MRATKEKNRNPEEHTTTPSKPFALVLGSGGARGLAHIGVLRALAEMELLPNRIAGTSIGSIVGAAYAAGSLPRLAHLAENLDWRKAAALFLEFGLPRSGLLEGKRVMEFLGEFLEDIPIEELPIPYAAVATDLLSHKEVVLDRGSLFDAIRASISIPGIFTPVEHGETWLVDGGLVNPLPVSVVRDSGAKKTIAVDVNLRYGDERDPGPKPADAKSSVLRTLDKLGLPAKLLDFLHDEESEDDGAGDKRSLVESLFGLSEKPRNDPPSMLEVITQALRTGENAITRERLLREPPDVLLKPAVGHIGTLEFHRSAESIAAGYEATMEAASEIKALTKPGLGDILRRSGL